MKTTKRSLFFGVVSMLLCVAMLMGTTYAWFTDSVTSVNNIIKTGSLDLKVLWTDDLTSGVWKDAEKSEDGPVFAYENWEPGYTAIRYIKIVNDGSLAFKYALNVITDGDAGMLGDVIDVYYVEDASTNVTSLDGITKAGVLNDVISGKVNAGGVLLPKGEAKTGFYTEEIVVAIALHMQETAGNEYQDKSVGASFAIQLIASQYDYEGDDLGDGYDDGAQWPNDVVISGNSASANVTPVDGKVPSDLNLVSEDGKISGNVPEGVAVVPGTDKMTLTVGDVSKSEANITLDENEAALSIDVHVSNIAEGNTVPVVVKVKELLPIGLNMGNYRFYHVEDGNTVEMVLLEDGATPVHNNYEYDPATGDVVLYLTSFSEIALVADTENAWEGVYDDTWYDADATELTIANADQLATLGAIVGGMKFTVDEKEKQYEADSFAGQTIKLLADINLGDAEEKNNTNIIFYPIGYWNNEGTYEKTYTQAITSGLNNFEGTFDGNGNTISNFYQNTWEMKGDHDWYNTTTEQYYRDGMGLFGRVYGGTVKNLTVDNFSSDGEIATTGVIAAYADFGATFENIAITNCNPRVYNIGNGGIVGCVGWYTKAVTDKKVTLRNITVDQTNMISALWGSYDVSCGGLVGQYYATSGQTSVGNPKNAGISFENCHVAAIMDVNNDVCANYQYYWYRYSGMLIGTIRANTKDESGYTVADTTGIEVANCTYTLGDWNEYWYCELVKNSLASYTHDHQFSRLAKIADISEIQDENGNWNKEGNFVIPNADNSAAECYHIFKNSDGILYRHFHNVADESNPNIYETFDLNGDGELNDLKEDRQCYFMPFNQVFNGLGYGVKPTYAIDGFTPRDDGLVKSEEKFDDLNTVTTYRPGQTITLGQLVSCVVDETKLSKATLYVAVSPAVDNENTNVSATYLSDEGNWADSTITFGADCSGAVKIVITDYFYCTPTVIVLNEEGKSEKFTAKDVEYQDAYTQITLGTLFGVKDGATIGNVTATVTDPNGTETTISGTSADWVGKTIDLTKDGEWTVSIVDDDKYCAVTKTKFTVNKADKFTKKFDKDFLYRVGNQNTVDVGYIFKEIETAVSLSSVNVEIEKIAGDATGKFTSDATWTSGTIQFTGTGVVKVTISADGANPLTINLEVVNATNITNATAGTGKNFVLLQDVTYTGTYLYYKNSTLYGNGFMLDITGADHSDLTDSSDTNSNKSAYCNIWMVDASFDNVRIVGSVYPEVGMTADSDYGNAAIRTEGDCYITNSYISNCRVPLRVQGNTALKNTVVDGGRYANIELRSGKLTLDGVTTINTVRKGSDGTTDVIGFGIVIHSEAANASISVVGDGLKQYNWVGENEHKTVLSGDTNLSSAYKLIFNANNSDTIYFDHESDRYVNTGILCLCADMTKDVVTGLDDRYCQEISGYEAWVLTYDNGKHTAWFDESIGTDEVNAEHKQQPVLPIYTGNEAQTVEFTKGETYYFDTSVLTAEKFGQPLNISSVEMNGTVYNYGDKIPVTEGGTFDIVYTVVDPYNYKADGTVADPVNHTVSITLTAVVKDAEILAPKFTFIDQNGNKYESTTVKAGDKTYVMPNVTAADPTTNSMSSINIGSASISGTTVYFPIATGYTVRSGSNFNRYYPLFNGINITDYTIAGDTTGTTYTTSSDHTSLVGSSGTKFIIPANGGQTNCGDYVKTDGQAGNAAGNSDSGWQGAGYSTSYGGTYLKSGNTNASSGADSNGYERIVWVEYCFNAGNGDVFYYRIGYHCNKESAQSCVTPDTLITLADGTQKRVDELTFDDKILAWDFFTGSYVESDISLLVNHGENQYEVIYTKYSDGTELKLVGEHGVFDYDLNKFIYITSENATDYIGHRVVKQNLDGGYDIVTLTDAYVQTEYVEAWSITSAGTSNAFASGLLTVAPPEDFYNWIEMDGKLHYDVEQFQKDVETYGLYTYDDFADYVTYEQFIDWNGAYLKIAVEKGYFTFDYILELIELYKGWMP